MKKVKQQYYALDLLSIDDAYEIAKELEHRLNAHEREKLYEYLAKRYQREVVEFLPCSD
jgi:hypothetical protein